jgi:hypothetical protein
VVGVRVRWVLVAVVAALLVRVPAITSLPIDSDESIYLEAADEVAIALRHRAAAGLVGPRKNTEHPGLVKLLYGVGIAGLGEDPSLVQRLAMVRGMSMMAGVATVAVVACIHPAAGLALATHTLHAKYSTEGYLDALPLLWMSLGMLIGWRHRHAPASQMMLIAAACWGAAIAGKWIHGMPGLVLLAVIPGLGARLRFGLTAAACAWLLDPTMWLDPWGRIMTMMAAHQHYAATVAPETFWAAPLFNLVEGGPMLWHPEVFLWSPDALWFGLGILGLSLHCRDGFGLYVAAWYALPLAFLMSWSTRWPQHSMVLVVPVCLGVGLFVEALLSRASRRFGPSGSNRPASE